MIETRLVGSDRDSPIELTGGMDMIKEKCSCGNPEYGFECVCDWVARHPGETTFVCIFCGTYTASEPHCHKCYFNVTDTQERFIIFRTDGQYELVSGNSVVDAMCNAGYGLTEQSKIAFITNGDECCYQFVAGQWVKQK